MYLIPILIFDILLLLTLLSLLLSMLKCITSLLLLEILLLGILSMGLLRWAWSRCSWAWGLRGLLGSRLLWCVRLRLYHSYSWVHWHTLPISTCKSYATAQACTYPHSKLPQNKHHHHQDSSKHQTPHNRNPPISTHSK